MKDTCFLMTTSLGAHVKTGEKFQFIIIIIIIIILLLLLLLLLVLVLVLLSLKKRSRNKAKIFAKLVMEGQINAALRYLSDNDSKGLLPVPGDVMEQLQEKQPEPQEARLGSLLFGPIEDIPDCLYHQIYGEMIRNDRRCPQNKRIWRSLGRGFNGI